MLRQHYGRPYFLPTQSESSKTDWIFMGSPGYGAHMHVSNAEFSPTRVGLSHEPYKNSLRVVPLNNGEFLGLDSALELFGKTTLPKEEFDGNPTF
ncbi:JmjC domain-containing protein 4 [Elysia marginata]|uniref:JmjC domain-containing protein 4 n=1 Tax=Elysia marginata TaxID=1093978 RepID=A0AAV4I4T3_9GAST|nr:JmjC domain-containing protein 4 [Elysia marginata]